MGGRLCGARWVTELMSWSPAPWLLGSAWVPRPPSLPSRVLCGPAAGWELRACSCFSLVGSDGGGVVFLGGVSVQRVGAAAGPGQPQRSLGQRVALHFRTAVNAQSGVCTPAGGLVTGRAPTLLWAALQAPMPSTRSPQAPWASGAPWLRCSPSPAGALVLLSLAYLTSLFYYIPKAALAAVIISAVVPMFDAGIFRTLWRVKSEGTSWGRSIPQCNPALPAEQALSRRAL